MSDPTIDPKRLKEVAHLPAVANPPQRAYVDRERGVVVQVWNNATPGCNNTPWQGALRVSVKHTCAKTSDQWDRPGYSIPITWDELQAIKDHFWPSQIAVEVYPPKDSIVNVADMRWLWVLPRGAVLPFNLQAKDIDRLVS